MNARAEKLYVERLGAARDPEPRFTPRQSPGLGVGSETTTEKNRRWIFLIAG